MVEFNAASAVLLEHARRNTRPTTAERRRVSGAELALETVRRAYLDELRASS